MEAGKVRNTHALKGEVKFECWLEGDQPLKGLTHLYPAPREEKGLVIKACRKQGDVFLVAFEGIDTVEEATLLKGRSLYASRKEADPDGTKIYFADLLDLPLIEDSTGTVYGTIREITSRGAGELFTVRMADGKEVYFPVVKEWILRMDPSEGVFVKAPEGLFD